MTNKEFGRRGEYLARLYLEKKGFTFIRANFSAKHGEIDLIMQENDEIVFVEVKTRTFHSAKQYGRGKDRIDQYKRDHIFSAAKTFMRQETKLTRDLTPRFDAIELYLDETDSNTVRVIHTPCAFGI